MAKYTANHITTYLLETALSNAALLGGIRHWDNLKGAIEGTVLWVKDITPQQAESIEIQGIPYKQLYYQNDNLLFLKGSLLPLKKISSSLLWSPLTRVLPIELPSLNHNYFGLNTTITIAIVPSVIEREPYAVLTSVKKAGNYIEQAPRVRLNAISWLGINNDVLLTGRPLLPVEGQTYWLTNNMLLPTGYDFELPVLYQTVAEILNPGAIYIVLWQQDGSYTLLDKQDIKPLTISSFRLTFSTT